MLRNLARLVPLAVLLPLARAEGTVQDLWNSPQYPDYTTNYTAGTTIEISWQHALATQFQFFCESCDITNVDLWVTGSSYTRKLEAGVNVNESTSYEWTINLDDADVEASTEWTFRFLPADVSWGDNQEEISSAKFNLLPKSDSSSSSTTTSTSTSTTSTSTAASTSTSTSTTTTTSPTADPTSTTPENATDSDGTTSESNSNNDGLSTGAKAGIGVGVSAGFIILAALAFLLWRRIRALPNTKATGPEGANGGYSQAHQGYFADPAMAKSMHAAPPATVVPMSELAGDHAGEMDAGVDSQRPPVELDASGLYSHHGR
ncbi:uncharacterized protein DSM5745_05240 [Aspergillus mulundensis]|uniref:Mid2 domain-containing protein n=1 Tax=Aspergillus mulundensis TaxID=1810919 RepID=A0A3D8S5V1_9EURO|nr:Uncharacterized protein DSM5745_05240 [Aspergillus mulundensis]RDW81683.1 Uncharacterized protein DSM5745_05240 [Aspergillus mulundensis]